MVETASPTFSATCLMGGRFSLLIWVMTMATISCAISLLGFLPFGGGCVLGRRKVSLIESALDSRLSLESSDGDELIVIGD